MSRKRTTIAIGKVYGLGNSIRYSAVRVVSGHLGDRYLWAARCFRPKTLLAAKANQEVTRSSDCEKRAVVLLNGRPEIWPGTEGIEAFAKAMNAEFFGRYANKEEALEAVAKIAASSSI